MTPLANVILANVSLSCRSSSTINKEKVARVVALNICPNMNIQEAITNYDEDSAPI